MRKGMCRRDPGEVRAAKERGCDQCGNKQRGEHPRRAQKANDGRPEKVVLLLDCERPCGADGGRQREVKEILEEEDVCPPGRCPDCVPDRWAYEPGSIQVADDEHEDVDGPDAEGSARVEIAKVVRLVAGLKQDRSDQKSGENEEEIDAGPAPQRGGIDPCAGKARVAVVENHGEDRDAAQSLQFWDVGGEPGWALDFQSSERAGRRVGIG